MSVRPALDTSTAPQVWRMLQCPRIGSPPLRFSGRSLDCRPGAPDTPGFELFARRKGGFTAALPGFGEDGWGPDAVTAPDFGALLDAVETHLADLAPPRARPSSTRRPGAEAIARMLAQDLAFAAHHGGVMHAAGRALDRWARLADGGAFQIERMHQ